MCLTLSCRKYKLNVVFVKDKFGPDLISKLSERLSVPRNFMFITSYTKRFQHNIGQLGGVRVITA